MSCNGAAQELSPLRRVVTRSGSQFLEDMAGWNKTSGPIYRPFSKFEYLAIWLQYLIFCGLWSENAHLPLPSFHFINKCLGRLLQSQEAPRSKNRKHVGAFHPCVYCFFFWWGPLNARKVVQAPSWASSSSWARCSVMVTWQWNAHVFLWWEVKDDDWRYMYR